MQTISYIADGVQGCPVSCVLAGLYAANVVLHLAVFSGRNPIKRPSRHPLLMLFRISVGIPLNIVFGAWLALWIVFWEFVRRPLWKPRPVCHTDDRDSASVAMCGGGFRTWYHLGIYWGLYDVFGVKGVNTMKFSGASIGALVATVAACGVHPADIWAHIPAIARLIAQLSSPYHKSRSILSLSSSHYVTARCTLACERAAIHIDILHVSAAT